MHFSKKFPHENPIRYCLVFVFTRYMQCRISSELATPSAQQQAGVLQKKRSTDNLCPQNNMVDDISGNFNNHPIRCPMLSFIKSVILVHYISGSNKVFSLTSRFAKGTKQLFFVLQSALDSSCSGF